MRGTSIAPSRFPTGGGGMMAVRLDEIARITGAELRGDGGVLIENVVGIEAAGQGDITFLSNPKYRRFLKSSAASAMIVSREMADEAPLPVLVADNPYYCFQKVLEIFYDRRPEVVEGIHDTAIVGEGVTLGEGVSIGPYAVVGDHTRIGDRTILCAAVRVGRNCEIGEETVIYPNVTLYRNTEAGNRVIFHAGAVIGSDGFGFAVEGGGYHKIPQVGRVVIEDDVEIGANTTIDRAAMGVTRIGRGTKIDNLVQIAHNVVIGENCGIAAQVGISGSTRIGDGVEIGGQAGFVGHIEIGDGSKIGAQAGVTKSFPPGSVITGYPARDLREMKRIEASETRLPELIRVVRDQGKRIEELERRLQEMRKA